MGIPTFFKTILQKHPSLIQGVGRIGEESVHYLFIDFNSIVYTCWHHVRQTSTSTTSASMLQTQLITTVSSHLTKMLHLVNPSVLTYISMDGVAPRAKMVQQRSRRYKSIQLQALKSPYQPSLVFDPSSNIAPGTSFMKDLSEALHTWRSQRPHPSPIIINDASFIGEGEHKFLNTIKSLCACPDRRDARVVIYSPDGDMISLALLTHKSHIRIMRFHDEENEFERHISSEYEYIYCDLDKVRHAFYQDLLQTYQSSHIDELRILTDYNILLFFAGNDFVPSVHFLKIRSGGLRLLISIYNDLRKKYRGEYLVDPDSLQLHLPFFIDLIGALARRETSAMKDFQTMITKDQTGQLPPRQYQQELTMTEGDIYCSRLEHLPMCHPAHPLYDHYKSVFAHIDFSEAPSIWKPAYYTFFSNTTSLSPHEYNTLRTRMVHNYFESLMFSLHYYVRGCPSWTWFYRYRVSPLPSDMYTVLTKHQFNPNRIRFQRGIPFSPFQQLMLILPPSMKSLIPSKLSALMDDPEWRAFYPHSFQVDALAGIKYIYSEAILPEFSEAFMDTLRNHEELLTREWTPEERKRNRSRFFDTRRYRLLSSSS